jgi:hypothetical protein
MAEYTAIFTKPYADGYEDLPSQDTPITAQTLNDKDDALEHIEDYLSTYDIPSDASEVSYDNTSGGLVANSVQSAIEELVGKKANASCLAYVNTAEGLIFPDIASKEFAIGDHFMHKGKFCTAIATIAQGATLTKNTNYVEGNISDYITSKDITADLTWNTSGNTFAHKSASLCGNVITINVRFSATVVSANHVLVEIPDKYMPKSGWYFGMIMKSWSGTPISAVVYKLNATGQLYLPAVTGFETGQGYIGSFTYII